MQTRRFALIRVEVEFQPIISGYAHEYIAKQGSSGVTFSAHFNAILVFEPKAISIEGTHMEMAQRTDDAAFKLYSCSGALDENTRRPRKVTRRAYRSVDTQSKRIRLRQFHLID